MRVARHGELPLDASARVAHYDLVTEIARGPRGSLWAAHAGEGRDAGRLVALRKIERASLDDASIAKLRAAASVAKRIRDPKIVAVLDVIVTDQDVAVVSEYIDGELLLSVQKLAAQKGASLPIVVAMRIALDLLTGIRGAGEAFRSKVPVPKRGAAPVHGGIGPECVLVASFGETMLTDLGVAGLGNCTPPQPGAMRYWAPERFDASVVLDERADIFSVGVLLWELVSNQPLFGSARSLSIGQDDIEAVTEKVKSAPIPRLDAVRRAGAPIPKKVADLVARALERDRKARFQSADEMIRAIFDLEKAVATPDEVVTALDRVARPILEARRAALGQLTDRLTTRDSAPPESNKGTYRPPPPATSVPPVVPKSPKVPLSMLVAMAGGTPLRSASNPPAADDSNKSIVRKRSEEPGRASASPVTAPPRAASPSRETYRAIPPPRAPTPTPTPTPPRGLVPTPAPPPVRSRPPKPPLPARATSSRPPLPSDDVETDRIAPRWQVAPPEATKQDLLAASPEASLPRVVIGVEHRAESSPPRSAPPPPAPAPGLDADAKGPFGWAPDDAPQTLDAAPDDQTTTFVGRRARVRAAIFGGAAAGALLMIAVALMASGNKTEPDTRTVATSSAAEAPAAPPPTTQVHPSPPPPTADAIPPQEPAPAAPSISGDRRDDVEPPVAPETAPPSQPRPSRPSGGDRPRPGNDDQKFRPRGI